MSRHGDWGLVGLGGDPTPGMVWEARELARVYRDVASEAAEASRVLARVKSDTSDSVWVGAAAEAFRLQLDEFPGDVDKCEASFRAAGDALSSWAGSIETFQHTADTNLVKARLAREEINTLNEQLTTATTAATNAFNSWDHNSGVYSRYQNTEAPSWVSVPKPWELNRLRVERDRTSNEVTRLQGSISDAQARFDAAKALILEAKEGYESESGRVVTRLDAAKGVGVEGDSWWEGIVNSDWWGVVVTIATVVVVIAAVAAIFATGPLALVLAGVALAGGALLFADDVNEVISGRMSVGEFVAFTAIGLIPGGRIARASRALKSTTKATTTVHQFPKVWGPHTRRPDHIPSSVVDSFRGGTFSERVLSQPVVMYRVSGGSSQKVGSYFSLTPQNGSAQSKFDLALLPEWGNSATHSHRVIVPEGTRILDGFAAPQTIRDSQGNVLRTLHGGGSQVWIEKVVESWYQ